MITTDQKNLNIHTDLGKTSAVKVKNDLVNEKIINQDENELKKELIKQEIKFLNQNHSALEDQANRIEDFTSNTAVLEMGLGLTSMLLEGKFNGDNFIYVVNSAFEYISNSTKKLPESFKKLMLDGVKLVGINLNNEKENISETFENNKEKILALYLKGLSGFTAGLSTFDYLGKRNKPSDSDLHPFKHITKLASSLIMAIPALPMLGTFSTKHKISEAMLEAKPKDSNAEALQLTGNEDFLCFMEASFLGARKFLSSMFPKQENILELIASLALSGLSFVNADRTLKECNGIEGWNFFKTEFMSKELPTKLYEGSRNLLNKLGNTRLESLDQINERLTNILKSKEKILQYN